MNETTDMKSEYDCILCFRSSDEIDSKSRYKHSSACAASFCEKCFTSIEKRFRCACGRKITKQKLFIVLTCRQGECKEEVCGVDELSLHQREKCVYTVVDCLFRWCGCTWQGTRKLLGEHLAKTSYDHAFASESKFLNQEIELMNQRASFDQTTRVLERNFHEQLEKRKEEIRKAKELLDKGTTELEESYSEIYTLNLRNMELKEKFSSLQQQLSVLTGCKEIKSPTVK
jgi:hypothetical protein